MPEYLEDPSVLTKEKLKSELLAHNVELPSGNPTKDVYVHLYLQKLTALNHKRVAAALDAFSSDEELPPPVVVSRSRSSGRKATRKTDKIKPDELDVTVLTDEVLRDQLLKHGVDAGPIVATTRKLYEKKLQKLLDNEPVQPQPVITEIQVNHNGNTDSDLYSDKEDEVTPEREPEPEPEPVAAPEPVPVVVRPLRSRGKTSVPSHTPNHHPEPERSVETLRAAVKYKPRPSSKPSSPLVHTNTVSPGTFISLCNISPIKRSESPRSLSDRLESRARDVSAAGECAPPDVLLHTRSHNKVPSSFLFAGSHMRPLGFTPTTSKEMLVEKIAAGDQTPKVDQNDVLKELFRNDNTPTGITATCRRPIRGAAGRPLKASDMWNDENSLFSPKSTKTTTTTSSYFTQSHTINRVNSLPPANSFNPTSYSTSRPPPVAPPAGQTKVAQRPAMSLWIKLFLLLLVAGFIFLVYQAMESNILSPFVSPETEVMGAGV